MTLKYLKPLVFIILTLAFASCVKEPNMGNPNVIGENEIPLNFDWKLSKEINLNILSSSSASNFNTDNTPLFVKVYTSSQMDSKSLIAQGYISSNQGFNSIVSIPAPAKELFVYKMDAQGRVSTESVDVSSTSTKSVSHLMVELSGFKADNSPKHVLTKAKSSPDGVVAVGVVDPFQAPDMPIPSNYDVIVNSNGRLDLLGFTSSQTSEHGNQYKSFYVPANKKLNINLDATNSSSRGHAVLYVAGNVKINGKIHLNKSSIVVLSGGSITIKGINSNLFSTFSLPGIYIMKGGQIKSSSTFDVIDFDMVNKGTLEIDGIGAGLNVTNSKVHNQGTIKINRRGAVFSYQLKLSGSNAYFYNSGIIETPEFISTLGSSLYNNVNSKISSSYFSLGLNSILYNHGSIENSSSMNIQNAELHNFCKILTNRMFVLTSEVNLYSSSLFSTERLEIALSQVNMSQESIISTNRIDQFLSSSISNEASGFALLKCSSFAESIILSTISGPIEFVHSSLVEGLGTNGRLRYTSSLVNGAILSKVQTKNIPGSACNMNLGQIESGDPGGNDPVNPPIGENGAVYYPSENGWGTYAFEDIYPHKGDYDLNDLVLSFRTTFVTNSANMVTKVIFDYKIEAIGAKQIIAAAFMLDKVPATLVKSVSGQVLGGGEMFSVTANGTEVGVSNAVIPIFNNATHLEPTDGFLNTVPGKYQPTEQRRVEVVFESPINASNLNMTSFNFFITTMERGREVHLPIFAATSKFDPKYITGNLHPTDQFKDINGMMFGLMFPHKFDYPAEGKSIEEAYLFFTKWAKSGGQQHADWYQNEVGYRNSDLIY